MIITKSSLFKFVQHITVAKLVARTCTDFHKNNPCLETTAASCRLIEKEIRLAEVSQIANVMWCGDGFRRGLVTSNISSGFPNN